MSYKENLKFNLEQLMKRDNVTNEALAEKTGISRSSINRIRMNKGNPTVETLLIICSFFNVSLEDITGTEALMKTTNIKAIPSKTVLFNAKEITLISFDSLKSINYSDLPTFYAIKSPQEYLNIPKDSMLIIEKNRPPSHGDYIIVMDKKHNFISIAEYIKDILTEYVRSIIQKATHQSDGALVTLDNFQVFGVILEARKIFIITC